MECRFGKVENNEMVLNEYGLIAQNEWGKLPERFPNFDLDVFQIMPNHMHGIIALNGFVGAGFTPAQNNGQPQGIAPTDDNINRAEVNPAPTIGHIVGAYKSLVANECLKIYKSNNEMMGKLWQRNYYEHIIKNESSYKTISEYIINNPQEWAKDKFYR
jgi:REP element-mobilizing transposase RayT